MIGNDFKEKSFVISIWESVREPSTPSLLYSVPQLLNISERVLTLVQLNGTFTGAEFP